MLAGTVRMSVTETTAIADSEEEEEEMAGMAEEAALKVVSGWVLVWEDGCPFTYHELQEVTTEV